MYRAKLFSISYFGKSCDDIALGAYAWMLMLIRYDVKEIRCHTKLVFTRELAYRQ